MLNLKTARQELSLLLVSIFILATLLVWIRALTVKSTYRFVGQEKEFRQLEQETQSLRVRWLKLTAPRKLESIASKIGLEPPKLGQTVKLQADSNIKGKF